MPEDEALLRALAQLERRRTREAAALREANALLAGLERMTAADGPAEALAALLDALRGALGCDATAVLTPEGGDLVFAHAAGLRLAGWLPGAAEAVGADPARLDDLSGEPWWPGDRRGVDPGSELASPPEPAAGRILSNAGPDAHQEVPHLHIHIFGGAFLGRMVSVPGRAR